MQMVTYHLVRGVLADGVKAAVNLDIKKARGTSLHPLGGERGGGGQGGAGGGMMRNGEL